MKFYKDKYSYGYCDKIINNNLTIMYSNIYIYFYKNGKNHNTKNAAFISNKYKEFRLNGKYYGNTNDFTKQTWRRFIKLQALL